ncbi:MAG: DUF4307 domain-containing protein [Nocardioidaceae bacterium]
MTATDLTARYGAPSRARRPVVIVTAVALLVAGAVWVVWVVGFHNRPDVSSQLAAYDVRSEHAATATWTVVRRDADVQASCLLQAVAADHAVVGELSVAVTSGPTTATRTSTVRTERRATSVQLLGCTTPDRPARH